MPKRHAYLRLHKVHHAVMHTGPRGRCSVLANRRGHCEGCTMAHRRRSIGCRGGLLGDGGRELKVVLDKPDASLAPIRVDQR